MLQHCLTHHSECRRCHGWTELLGYKVDSIHAGQSYKKEKYCLLKLWHNITVSISTVPCISGCGIKSAFWFIVLFWLTNVTRLVPAAPRTVHRTQHETSKVYNLWWKSNKWIELFNLNCLLYSHYNIYYFRIRQPKHTDTKLSLSSCTHGVFPNARRKVNGSHNNVAIFGGGHKPPCVFYVARWKMLVCVHCRGCRAIATLRW